MNPIKRVGPPRAVAESRRASSGYRWKVTLSDSPTMEWVTAFKNSGEHSSVVQPGRVDIEVGPKEVSFDSEESWVAEWIQSLDKWIAFGNVAVEAAKRKRAQQQADSEAEQQDLKHRLEELNNRFKDL